MDSAVPSSPHFQRPFPPSPPAKLCENCRKHSPRMSYAEEEERGGNVPRFIGRFEELLLRDECDLCRFCVQMFQVEHAVVRKIPDDAPVYLIFCAAQRNRNVQICFLEPGGERTACMVQSDLLHKDSGVEEEMQEAHGDVEREGHEGKEEKENEDIDSEWEDEEEEEEREGQDKEKEKEHEDIDYEWEDEEEEKELEGQNEQKKRESEGQPEDEESKSEDQDYQEGDDGQDESRQRQLQRNMQQRIPRRDTMGTSHVKYLDIGLCRSQLHFCETRHDSNCNPLLDEADCIDVILVDVIEQRLVETTSFERYLALSYTKGGFESLETVSTNIEALCKPGSLSKFRNDMSNVVKDAIRLTFDMGERYLWVDSLSIVQDDTTRKHQQINQMDIIYNHAVLTIIACSGASANDGLPGVFPTPRQHPGSRGIVSIFSEDNQRLEILQASPPLIHLLLDHSIYNSRGWTMQEHILSKRRLYLSEWGAYFECQCDNSVENASPGYREAMDDYRIPAYDGNPVRLARIEASNVNKSTPEMRRSTAWFNCYISLVQSYASRDLTKDDDVINAFSGVCDMFYRELGWEFAQCIPTSHWHASLLWFPLTKPTPRQTGSLNTLKLGSWSWAAWKAPMNFLISDLSAIHHDGSEAADFSLSVDEVPILRFTAFSVPAEQFTVGHTKNVVGLEISDIHTNGVHCGLIICYVLDYEAGFINDYEFVQVSKSGVPDVPGTGPGQVVTWSSRSRAPFKLFDEKAFPKENGVGVVDFLLVKWKDGVAERIGVGRMHYTAWEAGKPVRKPISLR